MKKVFLLLLLFQLIFISKSYSQDRWVYITKDEKNVSYYYDSQTIKYTENEISIYLKAVFSIESTNDYDKKYALSKWILYCGKERISHGSTTVYYRDGDIKTFTSNDYQDVLPESVGEVIYNYFCK